MKSINTLISLGLSLTCIVSATSCSDSNPIESASPEEVSEVPAAIIEDFRAAYPEATSVSWTVDEEYATVTFVATDAQSKKVSQRAWYDMKYFGHRMTSTAIDYEALPDAVKEAFTASDYGAWELSGDIEQLTRYTPGVVQDIYLIRARGTLEAATSEYEASLYYTADGVLVKLDLKEIKSASDSSDKDNDDNNDGRGAKSWIVCDVPDYVAEYVNSNYPGAYYLYVNAEATSTTAKIFIDHKVVTLLFDASGAWANTRFTIKANELPEAVLTALNASTYAGCKISSAEQCSSPEIDTYYLLTIKTRKGDKVELTITADGIISGDDDADGEGNTEPAGGNTLADRADIEAFIAEQYPDATIGKWDNDGDKLKVEITYNGTKISITFERTKQGYIWVSSEWDLNYRDAEAIPEAISAAISELYPDYQLYFITYTESKADGNYYLAGLKSVQLRRDIKVKFDTEGNVIAEYGNK
ncbi:MAG: PepSY-like domain-containing protein [Muribaculaceae bacterium]